MFEPSAVLGMIALVWARLLYLGQFDVTEFALDARGRHCEPFRITVIRP